LSKARNSGCCSTRLKEESTFIGHTCRSSASNNQKA